MTVATPASQEPPAGGGEFRVEARWPASIAVIVAMTLYVTLSDHFTVGPRWVVPALEIALLVPLFVVAPRIDRAEPGARRAIAIALIAVINLANVGSLGLLVAFLVTPGNKLTGLELLYSSASIWFTNVIVFALWYWELDRGGPSKRERPNAAREPDFLFPQMVSPHSAPRGWMPRFFDYVFVSFTNATAFSPTDTMPLTAAAKALFLVQSVTSLLTVVLVAARAVNILQ